MTSMAVPRNSSRHAIFDNRSTNATDVPNVTVGTNDALCGIERHTLRPDSLNQICRGIAIQWVDTTQVFLNTRRFAGRIESVHPKQFGRPIGEAIRFKGPASHIGETLPFGKIKFTSLQLLGLATEMLFRRFAFVNIHA